MSQWRHDTLLENSRPSDPILLLQGVRPPSSSRWSSLNSSSCSGAFAAVFLVDDPCLSIRTVRLPFYSVLLVSWLLILNKQ